MTKPSNTSNRIYRLDRFTVPKQARKEFLSRVKETHELLRDQPGFIQDFLLEQLKSDDEVIIATLVEWQDKEAMENAGAAVMAMRKSTGFKPQELIARLGIKAEMSSYTSIDA